MPVALGDRSYVVVHTAYVTLISPRGARRAFYEIVLAADHTPGGARYTYATADPSIAALATRAEGCEQRFTIDTRGTLAGLRREYRALVALEPVRQQASP